MVASTVKVRTYRQGLGDCHLVTIINAGQPVFRIMIDCGIYQTAPGGADKMRRIVANIIEETGGAVDLLVVTHEHFDHVSGFNQARDSFLTADQPAEPGKLKVAQVWMGWTEDPNDSVARSLGAARTEDIRKLAAAESLAQKFAAGGNSSDARLASGLSGILGFFGGARRTTLDALEHARSLAKAPRYCRPTDPPQRIAEGVVSYILGPPLDTARFKQLLDDDETYGMAERRWTRALASSIAAIDGGGSDDSAQPFDPRHRVPAPFLMPGGIPGTAGDFFDRAYWGPDDNGKDQDWRRIDGDWLAGSREFALKLDTATNNTSLVFALELEASGKILLFVADAQVGSWLSWLDLKWQFEGKERTGPELLAKTAFLKVGHHGSHNATLREKGLETMGEHLVAFIPTDEALAKKVGWGRMPLPGLVDALDRHAVGRVVRTDREFAAGAAATPELQAFAGKLIKTDLYYEVEIG